MESEVWKIWVDKARFALCDLQLLMVAIILEE